METALAIAAIVLTALTLAFVAGYGWRQSAQLSARIRAFSERTSGSEEQCVASGGTEAHIQDIHFFLPPRSSRPIAVFEGIQKESDDLTVGKEIRISRRWVTELHVRFCFTAPQRLRGIRWGFEAGDARVLEYRNAYAIETLAQVPKEIFKDRHGRWHLETPLAILQPAGTYRELAFTVKGEQPGHLPLEFEILTEEGNHPFRETLWVEIAD